MRKLTAMLILLALLSGCGAGPVENTQTAPPAATPELRVIEAGSGIFGREEIPMPEGYTSCSPYAEGRDRAFFKLTGSGVEDIICEYDAETGRFRRTPFPCEPDALINSSVITPEGGLVSCVFLHGEDYSLSDYFMREYDSGGRLIHDVDLAGLKLNDETSVFDYIPCEGGYLVSMFNSLQFVDYEGRAEVLDTRFEHPTVLAYNSEGGIIFCANRPEGYTVTEYGLDGAEGESWVLDTDWYMPEWGWGEDELYVGSEGWLCGLDYRTGELRPLINTEASGFGSSLRLTEDCWFTSFNFRPYVCRELPEGLELSVLKLAAGGTGSGIAELVKGFNASNSAKGIVIELEYYTGGSGMTRLASEVGAGSAPDLYDFATLPRELLARRGYLADLGDIVRDAGFAEGVINACTSADGGVYEFTPCFELIYCAISREYVPDGEWTPEDMLRLYEETGLPVFDPNMSREMFLEYYLAFNGGGCIDGGTRFDSAQFAALLEYASALPERFEPDMSVDMARICAGRQLCALEYGGRDLPASLCVEDAAMPEGCARLGFPSSDGGTIAISSDYRIGVSATTAQREAAEAFLSYALENLPYGSPPSSVESELRSALEERLSIWDGREEMTSNLVLTDENGAERVLELKGRTPGAAEVEAALALINSASAVYDCDETLLDIVIDEAGAYFAGDKSAEDACAIIQNRVDTYIAEQFG